MKLVVTGYARHGKDTVCQMLCELGDMKFTSSSRFVAERAVRPWLAERGIVYPSMDAMYADRGQYRADWFNAIQDYNSLDPARLGRELFMENDIYCGLRNLDELHALKTEGVVDCTIWVDASERLPPEDYTSITIRAEDADLVIHNHGTLEGLRESVKTSWVLIQGGYFK